MTATLTLTDFLLARIAEDEAVARAARPSGPWEWTEDGELVRPSPVYVLTVIGEGCGCGGGSLEPSAGSHIARHDPARVLAECEAKRRIVRAAEDIGWDGAAICQLLALPHADHPDYREEWRP